MQLCIKIVHPSFRRFYDFCHQHFKRHNLRLIVFRVVILVWTGPLDFLRIMLSALWFFRILAGGESLHIFGRLTHLSAFLEDQVTWRKFNHVPFDFFRIENLGLFRINVPLYFLGTILSALGFFWIWAGGESLHIFGRLTHLSAFLKGQVRWRLGLWTWKESGDCFSNLTKTTKMCVIFM